MKLKPLDKDGCHMTWEHFDEGCEYGAFSPDEGIPFYATTTQQSTIEVTQAPKPEWATHIVWYNK